MMAGAWGCLEPAGTGRGPLVGGNPLAGGVRYAQALDYEDVRPRAPVRGEPSGYTLGRSLPQGVRGGGTAKDRHARTWGTSRATPGNWPQCVAGLEARGLTTPPCGGRGGTRWGSPGERSQAVCFGLAERGGRTTLHQASTRQALCSVSDRLGANERSLPHSRRVEEAEPWRDWLRSAIQF